MAIAVPSVVEGLAGRSASPQINQLAFAEDNGDP
jgi:hypothetical protein